MNASDPDTGRGEGQRDASRGLFGRNYPPEGAAPGTFAQVHGAQEPTIHVFIFDAATLREFEPADARAAAACIQPGHVTWIDVQGLGDGSVVRELGELLDLHPLALSDVMNTGQRPKVDSYDGTYFIALRMATLEGPLERRRLEWEQISLFHREGIVVTFQETRDDCLDPLRERLRAGRKALRSAAADYLAVMVLDTIVDGYFPVLEWHGELLEALEDDVLLQSDADVLKELYSIRRELTHFRRAAWPLRDALMHLAHDDSGLSANARLYLRDTQDHVMQSVDVNETYRELANSLVEVHLSLVGQRTNEVMRVLTVVSTIFIPLTFLAGVYGMNFDRDHPENMPELGWRYGYVGFWIIAFLLAGSLLVLFRRLGWLGGWRTRSRGAR